MRSWLTEVPAGPLSPTPSATSSRGRYDALRRRELEQDERRPDKGAALELLALSEVLVRKAGCGRQLTVRAARAGGASWSEIGQALGTSRQAAWEGHRRWIEDQVARHDRVDHEGLDAEEASAARALAGTADEG